MATYTVDEFLILAKTYPIPSTKYRETSCVAAVTRRGELRRLYPIPFRHMTDEGQFAKWQWISAPTTLPNDDRREESRRIDVDRVVAGSKIGTEHGWAQRRPWIEPHIHSSFDAMVKSQKSLGAIRPTRLVRLEIKAEKNPSWTPKEVANLTRDGFFDQKTTAQRPQLRKLPYHFYYHYDIDGTILRHKINDWEVGAFYWKCVGGYGQTGWEAKLREKLENEFAQKDLIFLMGNHHRFQDQWLIISLIYPPQKQSAQSDEPAQPTLF